MYVEAETRFAKKEKSRPFLSRNIILVLVSNELEGWGAGGCYSVGYSMLHILSNILEVL